MHKTKEGEKRRGDIDLNRVMEEHRQRDSERRGPSLKDRKFENKRNTSKKPKD